MQAFQANKADIEKMPEAIKKDTPKVTYEMPGPLGNSCRKEMSAAQMPKDYETANAARAKNFGDKDTGSKAPSLDNVREGSKNMLNQNFNTKAKGMDL
jgi:hypothetical protein